MKKLDHGSNSRPDRSAAPAERIDSRRLRSAVLLCLSAAVLLRLADALLSLAIGFPRGVVRHASLEAAEEALGARLPRPRWLPSDLEGSPSEILTAREPPFSASLGWRNRRSGRVTCRLAQSFRATEPPSEQLFPAGRLFDRRRVDIAGQSVTLDQLEVPGEGSWDEIGWSVRDRNFVLRYRGPARELVRLVESIQEGSR